MGFLDKAKKLAEQAQDKLDEAQKQFNERQGASGSGAPSGPAVEYDEHGRPVKPPETATPPHGDPIGEQAEPAPPPPPPAATTPDPAAPPVTETPGVPRTEEDERPPKPPSAPGMSSGDPLAG
jgi:hypothetical protein